MQVSTRIIWNILLIHIEQDFTAYPDMKEGIGTVALLQAMDKSLQTGMPVKVKDILNEYGLEP